jgi:hypothetical protein
MNCSLGYLPFPKLRTDRFTDLVRNKFQKFIVAWQIFNQTEAKTDKSAEKAQKETSSGRTF